MYPTSQLPDPRRVQGGNPAVHDPRTEEPASPASLSRMSRRSKGFTQVHPPTFAPGSPARPGSGGGAEMATVTQPSRSACQRGAVTRRGGHDHKCPRRRAGATFQGRGPLQRMPVTCCAGSRSRRSDRLPATSTDLPRYTARGPPARRSCDAQRAALTGAFRLRLVTVDRLRAGPVPRRSLTGVKPDSRSDRVPAPTLRPYLRKPRKHGRSTIHIFPADSEL
jgi:hypothetical protein